MTKRRLPIRPSYLIPLAVFAAIAVFFAFGLRLDSRLVPSPLVGKQAPAFELPVLHLRHASFAPKDMKGDMWLLNVWASWCAACVDEHELLISIADAGIAIVGLNYKDEPEEAKNWLQRLGNPYLVVAVDQPGGAAIDWGVYGVPETFVIDAQGVIIYKHIGPISKQVVDSEILPLFSKAGS